MTRLTTLVTLLVFTLLAGCEDRTGKIEVMPAIEKRVCSEDTVTIRSQFILQCIAAANPKSDEEPEDWMGICERMAENLHCPMKQVIRTLVYTGSFWKTQKEEVVESE